MASKLSEGPIIMKESSNQNLPSSLENGLKQVLQLDIVTETKNQTCDAFNSTLLNGVQIGNEESFNRFKKLLEKYKSISNPNISWKEVVTGFEKPIFIKEENNILFVYQQQMGSTNNFLKIGTIDKTAGYIKELNSGQTIQSNNLNTDLTNLECETHKTTLPGSGVLDPEKTKPLQAEAQAITEYESRVVDREYQAKDGESLWKIIKREYQVKMSQSILDILDILIQTNKDNGINNITKDSKLKLGQTIFLPNVGSEKIQNIQEEDKQRRIAVNNAKGIKMKKDFK